MYICIYVYLYIYIYTYAQNLNDPCLGAAAPWEWEMTHPGGRSFLRLECRGSSGVVSAAGTPRTTCRAEAWSTKKTPIYGNIRDGNDGYTWVYIL